MIHKYFFHFLLFSVVINANAQTEDIRYYIEKDFSEVQKELFTRPEAETELIRLLDLSRKNFDVFDTTSAHILNALSDFSFHNRNFDKALEYSLQELEIHQHFNKKKELADAYTSLGEIYNWESENYKSEECYLKGLAIKRELFDHSYFENYIGLCRAYHNQGKFNLLKKYAGYALEIAKNPKQEVDANYYFLIGHARLLELDKGFEVCNRMIELSKKNGFDFRLGRAYNNLGWLQFEKNDYDKAIKNYRKGISLIEASNYKFKDRMLAINYSSLSNLHRRKNNDKESFRTIEIAISKAKRFYKEDYNQDMGSLYQNLASKHVKLRRDRRSNIKYTQEAIKCYMDNPQLDNINAPIPKEDLYKVNQKWKLLIALKEKSIQFANLSVEEKNRDYVEIAETHIRNAVELIDIMRAEMSDDDTKIFWRQETRVIYDIGLELSEWMRDEEKIFYYIEKSKSILLLDELNQKEALKFIPSHLAKREKQLLENYVESKDESHFHFSNYTEYLDSLKEAYPAYYKYKFESQLPSISEIQKELLDENTQLIQYYIVPDSIYTMSLTQEGVELLAVKKPKKLSSQIRRFLFLLNNKDSLEYLAQYEEFLDISKSLGDLLFNPIQNKKSNAIIVGDGMIGNLPFDVLSSEFDINDPHYLIKDHFFSFASSISVLEKKRNKRTNNFNSLLVVCPEEFKDPNLETLLQSQEEIKYLRQIADTEILSREKASLNAFKNTCSDFDVIHFSSHSGIDEESKKPWIAFQDSLIGLNEIYKLNLNASLVTLSSCKSFDGDFQAGEGINSMARAFLFADASAVIGSLWNLNEVSGYEILNSFYKNLKQADSKPEALRKAKLDFIEKNPYKSPFHWASLVCIGNPESLKSERHIKLGWSLPFLSLIILFLFYKKMKMRAA